MILFLQDRADQGKLLKLSSFRSFIALWQDLPVLLENSEFTVQVPSFVCIHRSLRKRLPVFPLLQMGLLSENQRTSYRYFASSEQKG